MKVRPLRLGSTHEYVGSTLHDLSFTAPNAVCTCTPGRHFLPVDDYAIEHEYLVAVAGIIAILGFIVRSVRVTGCSPQILLVVSHSFCPSASVRAPPPSVPAPAPVPTQPLTHQVMQCAACHLGLQVKIVYRSIMSGSLFLCKPCVRMAVRRRIRREHNEKLRKKAHERSLALAAEKAKAAAEEKRIAIAQAERTKHLKAPATKTTVAIPSHLLPEVCSWVHHVHGC